MHFKKKPYLFLIFCLSVTNLFAQKEAFDLFAYTTPAGWKKEVTENIISYTHINNETKSWCRIDIVKSTISKGSIEADFKSEWQDLVVKNYNPAEAPVLNEVHETDGWKIKEGVAKFKFNNADAQAMLTTISGFDRCASIVVTINSPEYLEEIDAFLTSVDFKTMETTPQPALAVSNNKWNGFVFTTTNFDDGWTSTVQEDWVEVSKDNIKVLMHYPNQKADVYNSVILDGLQNAWNILVTPKYKSIRNLEFKPVSGWQPIEFAEADAVESTTSRPVHIVLFKMNYSNGSGKYMEFITTDKSSFESEFGVYHQSSSGWDKMENMAYYNKFAVAASDLTGKWTSDFSGAIQYVNAFTGFDAGMDTHASNENFHFGPGNTYQWDLGIASGAVGNIKFQSVKAYGDFSMLGNWQVKLSDIEGKPRIYDICFSCIKGLRILWLDNKPYARVE